jgi:hypothetical protein
MISYLDIDFSREPIVNYNIADLLDLVWFALAALGLQVEISATPSRLKMWWLPLIRSSNPRRFSNWTRPENGTFASELPRRTWSSSFFEFDMSEMGGGSVTQAVVSSKLETAWRRDA